MASNKPRGQTFNKSKDNFFVKPTAKPANLNRIRQKNSNFPIESSSSKTEQKKPFDKNKWRLRKYSMKHKIEDWEERRKKAIVRGYNRERNQEKNKFDVGRIYEEEEKRIEEEEATDGSSKGQKKVFKKPHEQFLEKKEEKKRRKEEALKIKAEKEEGMKNYKKRKVERYKKLNRKTKYGQPIMKERMEYLLEKIQNSINV